MHYLTRVTRLLENERDAITDKALYINKLSEICRQFLPPGISRHIRAANVREGALILLADNQATAAKVRLLSSALSTHLAVERPEVSSVSVRVQPVLESEPEHASEVRKPSDTALSALFAAHQNMRSSPAREALGRFLRNQGVIVDSEARFENDPAARGATHCGPINSERPSTGK